jgi:hypothetical protein
VRRWAALPTLLLALAGVVQATRALEGAAPGAGAAGKLTQAERVMVYELTPEGGPRFRLAGGAEVVQLLVHLEVPVEGRLARAAGGFRYAVEATLRGPDGAVLWRREVAQRTRQTKEGRGAGGWDYEAAFVPDGRLELSDSASLELALPDAPPNSSLELRLADEAGSVGADGALTPFASPVALVRAYRRLAIDPAERELRRLALVADGGERRLTAATYLPWYALPAAQQRQRLAVAWERLAAEGRAGVDYRVRSIYVAPPRPPAAPEPAEPALTIGAGQPAVVQLRGPGEIEVRAWPLAALPPDRPAVVVLRLRRIGPADEGEAGAAGGKDMFEGTGGKRGKGAVGEAGGSGAAAGMAGGKDMFEGTGGSGRAGAAAGGGDGAGGTGGSGRAGAAAADGKDRAGGTGAGGGKDMSGGTGAGGGKDRAGGTGAGGGKDMSGGTGAGGGKDRAGGTGAGGGRDMSGGTGAGGGKDMSGGTGAGGAGAELVRELPVVAVAARREALALPPGLWSLELHTELPAVAVQVRADAPERHAGADDHVHHGAPGGAAFVPVDVRTLPVYALSPATPPLPFALAPDGDAEARFLEVEVRAWGTLAPVPVHYSFVDARGAALAGGDFLADAGAPAPFDRVRGLTAEERETPAPGTAPGFALGEAPVSQPVALRLLAPPGAATLRVSAGAPALVRVSGRLAAPAALPPSPWTPPYDEPLAEGLRWRHAPRALPTAFPRRADDHAARAAAGQVGAVLAQVRVEPAPALAPEGGPWRAEQPRGSHSRLRLLERVAAGRRAEALAGWGPGSYTLLRRGAPERIDLQRGGPRPPRLWYQATGSATGVVGGSLELSVDGVAAPWRVTSRAGRRGLPRKATATLLWAGGPEGVAVLVNRPPAGASAAPLYEHRQVHQLAGGLTLTVDKPGPGPVTLNVVVYWLDAGAAGATEISVAIDDGAPRRRTAAPLGGLSAGTRAATVLPTRRAEAIFPDRRGAGTVALARMAVVLGDDLAPGRHTLRLRHAGGPAVWLRFFRSGQAPTRTGAWQWSERRDPVIVEDDDDDE